MYRKSSRGTSKSLPIKPSDVPVMLKTPICLLTTALDSGLMGPVAAKFNVNTGQCSSPVLTNPDADSPPAVAMNRDFATLDNATEDCAPLC